LFKLFSINYSIVSRFNLYRFNSIILLLIIFFNDAACQRNISPQAQRAIDYFNSKQYPGAIVEFRKLLERYPKDALYQYYVGATLIEMNIAPAEAIENLKSATSNENMHLSWYYLYKIYYRQFRFDAAKSSLDEFEKIATRHEKKMFEISKEEERLTNASVFLKKALRTSVIDIKSTSSDSAYIYLSNTTHYKTEIFSINKLKDSIKAIVRPNVGLNEYRYFAANTNLGLKGKDIFRVKMLDSSKWSVPENLGPTINTSGDEDFPYFDEKSGTLYFASTGHGSIGGFDIFKSTFDSVKKEWLKPQQLPFPINSPWNDYLYVTDSSGTYFISDRESNYGNIKIYHIEGTNESPEIVNLKPEEKLQEYFLKASQKPALKKHTDFEQQIDLQNQVTADTNLLELISKALEIQLLSDSARLVAKQYKNKLADEDNKEKRVEIFSEISKYEKKTAKYQKSANDLYLKINEIQFNKPSNTQQSKNNNHFRDTSIFSIEASSPYSDENPFPTEIEFPGGIIYRIQLGVYSKPVEFDYFGGVQPITAELIQENKIIKYYAGIFKRFDKADISLRKVKEMGFKEAFLVAFLNNKKIPVDRAKELEKRE
jgi:hypothetical protein